MDLQNEYLFLHFHPGLFSSPKQENMEISLKIEHLGLEIFFRSKNLFGKILAVGTIFHKS